MKDDTKMWQRKSTNKCRHDEILCKMECDFLSKALFSSKKYDSIVLDISGNEIWGVLLGSDIKVYLWKLIQEGTNTKVQTHVFLMFNPSAQSLGSSFNNLIGFRIIFRNFST